MNHPHPKLRIDLRNASEGELAEFAKSLFRVAQYLADLGLALQMTRLPNMHDSLRTTLQKG